MASHQPSVKKHLGRIRDHVLGEHTGPASTMTRINNVDTAIHIKPNHRLETPKHRTILKDTVTDGLSSIWNGSEHKIKHQIHKAQHGTIKSLALSFNITGGVSDCFVVPSPFFMTRIELRTGGDKILHTFYAEDLMMRHALLDESVVDTLGKIGGFSKKFWIDSKQPVVNGNVANRVLTLIGSMFENIDGLDAKVWKQDVWIWIYTAPNIITSGGSSTATLTSLDIIYEEDTYWDADVARTALNKLKRSIYSGQILECILVPGKATNTLAAGVETTFDLDELKGKKIAYLLVVIRASATSVTNNAIMKGLELDPDNTGTAKIDVKDGSIEVFGTGGGISIPYLRYLNAKDFPNEFLNSTSFYVIPFTDHLAQAVLGSMAGGNLPVPTTNLTVKITPSTTTGAVEIHTLTPAGGAATAGTMVLEFDGGFSTPVAHTATVAVLKAALEAIPQAIDFPGGVSVVFNSTLAVGATTLVTFSDARQYPLVRVFNQADVTGATGWTTTRSQKGVGWVNTTTANVQIFASVFREMHVNNGTISVNDSI